MAAQKLTLQHWTFIFAHGTKDKQNKTRVKPRLHVNHTPRPLSTACSIKPQPSNQHTSIYPIHMLWNSLPWIGKFFLPINLYNVTWRGKNKNKNNIEYFSLLNFYWWFTMPKVKLKFIRWKFVWMKMSISMIFPYTQCSFCVRACSTSCTFFIRLSDPSSNLTTVFVFPSTTTAQR